MLENLLKELAFLIFLCTAEFPENKEFQAKFPELEYFVKNDISQICAIHTKTIWMNNYSLSMVDHQNIDCSHSITQ